MRTILLAAGVLSLAACVSTPPNSTFVADLHGKDLGQYNIDLGQCNQYATSQPSAVDGAVAGVAAGAIVGALLAVAIGVDVGDGAAFGATAGGIQGAGEAGQTRKQIVGRCMEGRGYSVLAY